MESKTLKLVKGRKKLRYFTSDDGVTPVINEVFSIRDIDEFLDCVSEGKLDSGFLSPLLHKGTPEMEVEEKEAQQEAECVALPTEERSIDNGLADKGSPFKDSAPLKTSSPIVEATSSKEVESIDKPLGSPLLLVDDNEDPIEGNMDKSLSVQMEDPVKEPLLIETLTLTPAKKFSLGVETYGDKSPVLTPLKGRSHVNLIEKNLSSKSKNNNEVQIKRNEEQSSMSPVVSTQIGDAEPVFETIQEPDASLKASRTSSDGSFQKKLRDLLTPRNLQCARMPVPPRAPSPEDLDEDFFILEDETPLLFSLKRKNPSQASQAARQPSKKPEAESRPEATDRTSFGMENTPGPGGMMDRVASTSQQAKAKTTAVQKKSGKATAQGDEGGASLNGKKVEDHPSLPSEAPSKAPHVMKKGRGGKSSGKQAGAKEAAPEPEGALAEAYSLSVPQLKDSVARTKRVRRGRQPVAKAQPEEQDKGTGNMATVASSKAQATEKKKRRKPAAAATAAEPQTEFERRPETPKSKASAPTATEEEENHSTDYAHSPATISSTERPKQKVEKVTKKARRNSLQRQKPFLHKKAKKRSLLRRSSDMFAVSISPELKSHIKPSKAASSTARPAKDQSHDSADVPSQPFPKRKGKTKEKESMEVETKRGHPWAAPPQEAEEGGDEGQGITQSDLSLTGDRPDAAGDSEATQQEPTLDLSGPSAPALSKRKRNKPGNWWEVIPDKGDKDSPVASSPPKRLKVSKREDGRKRKKAEKKEAAVSLEQDPAGAVEERARSPAELPEQPRKDRKAAGKSRARKVKRDGQTGKGRKRNLQEEATSSPASQGGEEIEAETHQATFDLQVNMSSEVPEVVHKAQDGEAARRTDVPQPQRRQRRPPSNWWESQRQQPEPDPDIISSQSPPPLSPGPRARVPTPSVRNSNLLLGRAAHLNRGSPKPRGQLRKKPTVQHAGTPRNVKATLMAFEALYTSGKHRGKNATTQKVRKNLMNSLEDSSNRSNDHMSMDCNTQDRLNCDYGNPKVCDQVDESRVRLKPSQSLGVAGLRSGPSSMIDLQSFEEDEEDQGKSHFWKRVCPLNDNKALQSSLRIPMALSEGDICGPLLRPLTLVSDDWQNLTYWLREVWQTSSKHPGQLITADHFHWYTHEGRALGHMFDLVCSSYANGKLLLGSYMRKPEKLDQHTTTVFNVCTSSVRVQIKDLKSDYNPGQAFVVPRGQSYSICNLTPVPAILWYHRMFQDLMEDS